VLFGIFKIMYAHGVYKSVYLCSQTTQLFLVFSCCLEISVYVEASFFQERSPFSEEQ